MRVDAAAPGMCWFTGWKLQINTPKHPYTRWPGTHSSTQWVKTFMMTLLEIQSPLQLQDMQVHVCRDACRCTLTFKGQHFHRCVHMLEEQWLNVMVRRRCTEEINSCEMILSYPVWGTFEENHTALTLMVITEPAHTELVKYFSKIYCKSTTRRNKFGLKVKERSGIESFDK